MSSSCKSNYHTVTTAPLQSIYNDFIIICYIRLLTQKKLILVHLSHIYLLSFGKAVVNQFTSCRQNISKRAIEG